jgi:hypothetical protein
MEDLRQMRTHSATAGGSHAALLRNEKARIKAGFLRP